VRQRWCLELYQEAIPRRLKAHSTALASFNNAAAVLSLDKSWLYWRWGEERRPDEIQYGAIVVDLLNGEYRQLNNAWQSVAWIADK
jgi:hypothetical protein